MIKVYDNPIFPFAIDAWKEPIILQICNNTNSPTQFKSSCMVWVKSVWMRSQVFENKVSEQQLVKSKPICKIVSNHQ